MILMFGKNLKHLRKKNGLNQQEIADLVEKGDGTISNWEKGTAEPSFADINEISKYFRVSMNDMLFTDLSIESPIEEKKEIKNRLNASPKASRSASLISKNRLNEPSGEYTRMPKVVTIDSTGADNITFVPIRASAGYLAGYEDPEFIQTLPTYKLPGLSHGTFRVFEIYGHSMVPTFFESDRIVCRYVENFNEIRDNRVYTVVTRREGIVAKRVVNRLSREGKLILNSDNQRHPGEYPPIILDPEEVLEIWYGVMYLSRQMREPGEIYNRLIDVESRLTLLEQRQLKSGE